MLKSVRNLRRFTNADRRAGDGFATAFQIRGARVRVDIDGRATTATGPPEELRPHSISRLRVVSKHEEDFLTHFCPAAEVHFGEGGVYL